MLLYVYVHKTSYDGINYFLAFTNDPVFMCNTEVKILEIISLKSYFVNICACMFHILR